MFSDFSLFTGVNLMAALRNGIAMTGVEIYGPK
jgi:hypothetical protein